MGGVKVDVVFWRFLLFLGKRTRDFAFVPYVMEEAGRKCVWDICHGR